MTNLYEEGKFGGIPKAIFNLKADNIEGDSILVCELDEGFEGKGKKGKPISDKDSMTLYIDGEKVEQAINENDISKSLLFPITNKLFQSTRNGEQSSFLIICNCFNDNYSEDCKIIAEYLHTDYLRLKEYEKADSSRKSDIFKRHIYDLKKIQKRLIDIYYPDKSRMEQEQAEIRTNKTEAEKRIKDYQKEIEEHLKEIEDLKKHIAEEEKEIDEFKWRIQEYQDYFDMRYKEEDSDKVNCLCLRASKNTIAEEYLKGLENIHQELKNATQEEESSIPEEIRRKARYFLDKGYIKEEKGHYVVDNGFTGQEIAWINKYKLKDLGKDYFTINEMALYIWKNKTEPYKKSNFTSLKIPNKSIED